MGVNIYDFSGEHGFVICCDFCAAPSDKVQVLIASPNGNHICGDCARLSARIADEKLAGEADK